MERRALSLEDLVFIRVSGKDSLIAFRDANLCVLDYPRFVLPSLVSFEPYGFAAGDK